MVREVERRIGSSIPRRKVEGIESVPLPVAQQAAPSPKRRSRRRYRRAS
jgi:hypothetical protein